MAMLNQDNEAQMFAKNNAQEIAATKALVTQAIRALSPLVIAVIGHSDFLAEQMPSERRFSMDAWHAALTAEIIDECKTFWMIRGYAHLFSPPVINNSAPYWNLIDAIGFLWDATGTQWPYMTQERRLVYLSLVNEYARDLIAMEDTLAALAGQIRNKCTVLAA